MKKAYFVVDHTLPTDHPNGIRIANLGRIFKLAGYDVHLIGFHYSSTCHQIYDGMKAVLCQERSGSGFKTSVIRGREQLVALKSYFVENGNPDVVVSGLFNCPMQRFLMRYCKKHKIDLIESVCEWYDRNIFVGMKGVVKFLDNRFSLYVQLPRFKKIIAIATLQASYYEKKGCMTMVVPTIVDVEEYASNVRLEVGDSEKMKIAYAGSPGRKDYILNAVYALPQLSREELAKIEIHFYGPEIKAFYDLGLTEEFLDTYKDNIFCHGRIPYAEVKEKIAAADFTVLLRPNKRYANAGFPTKVGESMACGTPVIANITSDLGKYIIDGKTGIVCENESPEACAEAFRRALAMTADEKTEMRKAAYEMANVGFNYLSYVDAMREFLEKAI